MENTDTVQPEDDQVKATTPDTQETDAYYGGDEIGDGELDLSFLDEDDDGASKKPKDGSVG